MFSPQSAVIRDLTLWVEEAVLYRELKEESLLILILCENIFYVFLLAMLGDPVSEWYSRRLP